MYEKFFHSIQSLYSNINEEMFSRRSKIKILGLEPFRTELGKQELQAGIIEKIL